MIIRDRILHGVLGVAVVMLLLVPFFSSFSMRQMQEVAITLSLSATSLVLLIVTLFLGTSAVWRDIERKYTESILTLPISRLTYLLAKYLSIVLFLITCGFILFVGDALVVLISSLQYPSDLSISWWGIALAVAADVLKYLLLAGVAMVLSAVSTSFFLPFFGTLAIYLAGSASQEVFEYVSGQFGQDLSGISSWLIKAVYYLLPNFSAFDFKVHAVYALPITVESVCYPLIYAMIYIGILFITAVWAFNRREIS
jgi:ABC-type transport system involved in multi-copper enzyme maturation permease subunit